MIASQFFSEREMTCSHCGVNGMQQSFMAKMDELRETCGFPLPCTSGFRCAEYNRIIGGSPHNHPAGLAMDIAVSGAQAHALVGHAIALGFLGIGVRQKGQSRFVHLDMTPNGAVPRPWIWSY